MTNGATSEVQANAKALKNSAEAAGQRVGATLEEEIAILREDIARLASSFKHMAAGAATTAVDRAKEKIDKASADVKAAASTGKNTVEQTVAEHPLSAVLVALGLGFLIGTLMRRN